LELISVVDSERVGLVGGVDAKDSGLRIEVDRIGGLGAECNRREQYGCEYRCFGDVDSEMHGHVLG
jgi:hypothetical protein